MFNNHLMKACLAAVFAIGLAACSSSSDQAEPAPTEPPPPTQAEQDLEMLKNQIAALRQQLGIDESDDVGASITELQETLAALQKQVDDAQDEKDKMAAEAAAKDAVALFDGIVETTTNLTVTISAVADKDGDGGMASVTAAGLTPGVGGDDVMKSAEPMLGSWQGTMLTDTNDDDASSTVVVYTDIVAPKAVPFGDVYTLDTNGDLANATVILAANYSKIKATAFTHAGRMDHDPDPASATDVAMIRGTFNGASGEYRCTAATATSCASHDAGDGAVRLEGTWIFDPDSGAMATMVDPSFAYFGWWLNKGTTDGVEAGVFHGVTDGSTPAALEAPTDINALGGTATYNGSAAGKYAIKPGLSSASGGHWTADATLTAKWGAADAPGMISGTVDGFMAGGEAMDWSVALGEAPLVAAGTFTSAGDGVTTAGDDVVWTIGGVDGAEAGSWSGALYAEGDNNVPTVASGMFTGTHGTVGHIMGAFGAHLDE